MTKRAMYSVFDRTIAEAALGAAGDTETLDKMDAAVAGGAEPGLVCADTVAEAAEKAGLDAEVRVLTDKKQPIEGLYAVGTDGCMLYRNIYTINVGGACNANNVNSGRSAANHAHTLIAG